MVEVPFEEVFTQLGFLIEEVRLILRFHLTQVRGFSMHSEGGLLTPRVLVGIPSPGIPSLVLQHIP